MAEGAAWALRGMQMLPGLAPRPQHHIVDKKDHDETIDSTSKSLFVFIKDCTNTRVVVNGKVGKVTIENGKHLNITVNDKVVGGTVELIRCEDVHLFYGLNAEIPILQVDDSSDIDINISSKAQIQSIYYIRSFRVKLMLSNAGTGDLRYDFSPDSESESLMQRVAHWSEASAAAHFITEVVVRDGIYPTTAQMKNVAAEREEKPQTAETLVEEISINKPENAVSSPASLNTTVDMTMLQNQIADEGLDDLD